jgi:non-specific protein-tyrosine kinase
MGKISEALKKAGRENRPRPLDDSAKRDPRENAKTVPEHQTMPRQSPRVSTVDEKAPAVEKVASPVEGPVMVEKPAPIIQATAPMPDRSQADLDLSNNPDVVIPAGQPHHAPESKNIAVVRTSKPDEPPPSGKAAKTPARSGKPDDRPRDGKTSSRSDIQISYSRTKVQAFDPETLKNNKIFSMFDDIETTDQIKILRTQVLKKLADIGGNSILVTSANPYEGKTFTSINLGVSIAKEFNRTVLIIDADLRKPTKRHTAFSTEFFTLDVEVGLTDYLKGEADIPDILINPGISKLTLIPSGRPVYNAPELLSSSRMEEMMSEIKSRYPADRLVIVDGPAMLPFPDALILSRYVDGVLPVVEVERTPADQLKKMMELLKETRVLGTVMNKSKG